MREIKFRAWNKKENRWANINQLTDWGSAEMTACVGMGNEQYPYQTMRIESDEIYELMQFTGLTDKNGKEIYEGDILKGAGIVSWNEKEVRWSCIHIEWNDKKEWHDMLYLTTPLEVIGNIYEHKHLLDNIDTKV